MKINEERLWRHIQELGQIGRSADGSVTRFPFTKEDEAAARLLKEMCIRDRLYTGLKQKMNMQSLKGFSYHVKSA